MNVTLRMGTGTTVVTKRCFIGIVAGHFRKRFKCIGLNFSIALITVTYLLSLVFVSNVCNMHRNAIITTLVIKPVIRFIDPCCGFLSG